LTLLLMGLVYWLTKYCFDSLVIGLVDTSLQSSLNLHR